MENIDEDLGRPDTENSDYDYCRLLGLLPTLVLNYWTIG